MLKRDCIPKPSIFAGKDDAKCKKFSKKLSRLIKEYQLPQDLNKAMIEQLRDDEFRSRVVAASIEKYYPEHPFDLKGVRYELEFLDSNRFLIHTNINFDEIGKIAANTPILALINCCEDLQVMSENKSEVSLPEFNSKIIRIKANSLIEKSIRAFKEIEVFNHFVFDNSWALRDAINSKHLHVKAILDALRNAQKYKEWLGDLPSDSNLMGEYVKKVKEKNILSKLPLKPIRFYLFNGLAFILGALDPQLGIPATVAANAFDSFLLERMTQKWTPNQFIEETYRPLVKK